jgi:putative tryptophan/tyrosine transport system substrate-binding protein
LRIADETPRIHLGLGAAAWPLAAQPRERALPTIGWLHSSLDNEQDYIPAFYRGLAETGFVEGSNVAVEHRRSFGSGQGPALAADLVHREVAVMWSSQPAFR